MTTNLRDRLRRRTASIDEWWPDRTDPVPAHDEPAAVSIADAPLRRVVKLGGRIRSVRVQPRDGIPTLECVVCENDSDDSIVVVFLGRRAIAGIEPGRALEVAGVIGMHHGRRRMLNPVYRLHA